jgi:hypothetical protein
MLGTPLAANESPKFTITPHFAPEPAVVTFLLLNIPDKARTACFVLEGDSNHQSSCRDIDGRKSFRLEHRNVLGGTYEAFVTVDQLVLPVQNITITKVGPE